MNDHQLSTFSGPLRAVFFLALAACAGSSLAASPAAPLVFERVFSAAHEPGAVHYKVSYQDARGAHELEVWRDGKRRLRRRTDDALDLYANALEDGDYSIAMLDHGRHVRTDITRSSLIQLGQFSDWFGLAHGLTKPLRPYTLQRLAKAPADVTPLTPCQWYELSAPPQHSAVCWSAAYRLPVLIATPAGQVRWQLTAVDKTRPAPATFEIADKGYIQVDAEHDIKAD